MKTLCNCMHSHVCPHTVAAMGLSLHVVPGRLRLDVPGLGDDPTRVEHSLAGLAGVGRVPCSLRTGRVLVEFDPKEQIPEAALVRSEAPTGFGLGRWVANSLLGGAFGLIGKAASFALDSVLKLALG